MSKRNSNTNAENNPMGRSGLKNKSSYRISKEIPSRKPSTSNMLNSMSHGLFGWLPQRFEKIFTRSLFGALLLILFYVIFQVGISAMILFFTFVVAKCYQEVISVGHRQYKELSLPLFRFLQWFFLLSATFYVSGDIFILLINNLVKHRDLSEPFANYQKIIAFSLYMSGIIIFVLNLKKKKYRVQFSIFAWYQLTLMILMVPLQLLLRTIFYGLIWVYLPMILIITNDVFAYFFGIAFGKTPLIKLSPKKTWEGFIGGAFSTMVAAIAVTYVMVQYPSFYCPVKFDTTMYSFVMECERAPIFTITSYPLPDTIVNVLSTLGFNITSISYYPMYVHAIVMGLFASLISPFGGFFASGFKRAFKVKDFGDSIPGHGGMMDRMDCQVLMCVFVNIYIKTFIRYPTPNNLLRQFIHLSSSNQQEFYRLIKNYLLENNTTGIMDL